MTPLPTHIHLLGIGGMGMAPLALYLQQTGIRVTGEDDYIQEWVATVLRDNGIEPLNGKRAERAREKAPLIAWSSAVAHQDPRLVAARSRGAQLMRRGELLARLVHGRRLLAITGSHGKTTTAAMLVHILRRQRFSFDYVLGGFYRGTQILPAGYMGAAWVVAEVDESDGTIDGFAPAVTLQVNFDWDHPDRYPNREDLEHTVEALFSRTREHLLIPSGNETLEPMAVRSGKSILTFGQLGDYQGMGSAVDLQTLTLSLGGRFPAAQATVAAGGDFNAINALSAFAAAHCISGEVDTSALEDFPGIRRRQDRLYVDGTLEVYADYAHHPTEVEALLNHFKAHRKGRLGVIFQPHRYSRTRQYADAFARVLEGADTLCLLPVYAASEAPDVAGETQRIIEKLKFPSRADYCEDFTDMSSILDTSIRSLDTILFVGAGDIEVWAQRYVGHLKSQADRDANSSEGWFAKLAKGVSEDTLLSENERLDKKTTLRVGGTARWYAEPANREDLQLLLQHAHHAGIEVFVLGRGSNLLISDTGYTGLVIHLHAPIWRAVEALDTQRLEVGAGVRLQALSAKACKLGMAGFEFLEGIPGSLGGALRMNAGAMGGWMFDVVESVDYITLQGEFMRLPKADFEVGYRSCEQLKTAVALSAVLRAPAIDTVDAIRSKMDAFAGHRVSTQPREPSAGCMFKNPEGGHAGKIIDELGLKGYRIGNAQISEVHGNFIINLGGATSSEVLGIMRHVRAEALRERGVKLEPEVMLIGKRWEEVL